MLGLGLALGGCMLPIELFSPTLQTVAHFTPHAWGLDAFAELVRNNGTIVDILPELGVLLGFAAVLLTLATWRLRVTPDPLSENRLSAFCVLDHRGGKEASMRRVVRVGLAALLLMGVLAAPATASPPTIGERSFTVALSGANEVPPADPDGTGTARIFLHQGRGQVCFHRPGIQHRPSGRRPHSPRCCWGERPTGDRFRWEPLGMREWG